MGKRHTRRQLDYLVYVIHHLGVYHFCGLHTKTAVLCIVIVANRSDIGVFEPCIGAKEICKGEVGSEFNRLVKVGYRRLIIAEGVIVHRPAEIVDGARLVGGDVGIVIFD